MVSVISLIRCSLSERMRSTNALGASASSVSQGLAAPRNEPAGAGRQQIILLLVCMAVLLDALDTGIVNIALPHIQQDLHLSTLDLPWIQSAYVLTFGGFLLLGGRSADLFGRRRIFLIGTTIFGLASLICGLASSGWLLILARGVQGIGAALTVPARPSPFSRRPLPRDPGAIRLWASM
jgi:MFS family permease